MARNQKNQTARTELTPQVPETSGETNSNYKLKDSFFDKTKTYIEKGTKLEKEFDANWRHLNIGGQQMTLFEGVVLTKSQLAVFDKEAKAYWLDTPK